MSFDINAILALAKKTYNQKSDSFYISSKDIEGLHIAVLPHFKNYIFSEYIFGNAKDMNSVLVYAFQNSILKSFYCSICAIEEPDNITLANPFPCNDFKKKSNMANQVNTKITLNKIPCLITGTVPQYYYNHLLFLTASHYSTYSVFENYDIFIMVKEFLRVANLQNKNIKLIFNGNFGSDRWHFHCHVTDQILGYMENELYTLNTLENVSRNGKYGIVKYKVIASSDFTKLYNEVRKFALIYQTPEYLSGSKYLSATFTSKIINGELYMIIFLISGNKFSNVVVNGNSYFSILPSCLLNVTPITGKVTKEEVTEAIKTLEKQNVYEYLKPFNEKSIQTPYIIEKMEMTYVTCAISPDYKTLSALYNEIRDCISQKQGCVGPKSGYLAIFKYLISILFICKASSHKKRNMKTVIDNTYKELMNDVGFMDLAVQSGIGVLTKTYKLDNTINLFLKGPVASKILSKAFANFGSITSKNLDFRKFQYQTQAVNFWVQYEHPPTLPSMGSPPYLIGDPSAYGAVLLTNIRRHPTINFIIKANKTPQQHTLMIFLHEFAAGMKVNLLRKNVPNFVLTLAGFECVSDPTLDKLCQLSSHLNVPSKDMQYIMLEYLEGITLNKYIMMSRDPDEKILMVLAQVATSLLYAQKKIDFTHYDLHTGNVMISHVSDIPVSYEYHIGTKIYQIPSHVNATIIDYGNTHVSGIQNYANPGLAKYGMTTNISNFHSDIFTLVINIFFVYLLERSVKEITQINDILYSIILALFSSYSTVFIPNALDYILIEYHSFISRIKNKDDKRTKLIHLFNSTRIDKSYYLYLPPNTKPLKGIYESQEAFVEFITSKMNKYNTTVKYIWGDNDHLGCIMPLEKSLSGKIKESKMLF
jgi:serine/threonine protein kinase